MKHKFFLSIAVILLAVSGHAQFYKSLLPSPEFTGALEKIVLDFRLNYKTIQGDQVMKEGDIETYESMVKLPGAKECVIYKFNSGIDTSASFQAVMYSGEDYKEAVNSYENLFRLVKKSHIKWIDRTMVGFAGEMDKPNENVRFTVSTLRCTVEDDRYRKFSADVEMVPSANGWEVRLNIQSKGSDTEGVSNGY